MPLAISRLARLFDRLEAGEADPDLVRLAAFAKPWAPDAASWRRLRLGVGGLGAVALLVSALIFFFAANWEALSKFAKLGLASVAFLGFIGTAGVAAATGKTFGGLWRGALLGAALCVGALLALIGQIYQTGADVWELFAYWTLLMTPCVALARSSAAALVWIGVANLALWLAPGEFARLQAGSGPVRDVVGVMWRDDGELLLRSAAGNALLLCLFERLYRRWLVAPRRWVQQLLAGGVMLLLFLAAVRHVYHPWHVLTAIYLACSALFLFWYGKKQHDAFILGMTSAWLWIWSAFLLGAWLPWEETWSWFWSSAVLGGYVLVVSTLTGRWLLQRVRAERKSVAARAPEASEASPDALDRALAATPVELPSWLKAGQALAAWVTAALFASALAITARYGGEGGLLVCGALLTAMAMGLFYHLASARKPLFFSQLALAFSLAGQGLIAAWLAFSLSRQDSFAFLCLGIAVLAGVLSCFKASRQHKSLCALVALAGMGAFPYLRADPSGASGEAWLQLETILFAVLALILWDRRPRWYVMERFWRELLIAYANGALCATFGALLVLSLVYAKPHFAVAAVGNGGLYALAAPLLLGGAVWRQGGVRLLLRAAPFMLLCGWLPWLGICAALGLTLFRVGNRSGFSLSLLAAVALLGHFYYGLQMDLLSKSAALAVGGVFCLGLLPAWSGWKSGTGASGAAPGRDSGDAVGQRRFDRKWGAALLISALAALLPAWGGIARHERTLATGRVVLLELAPADPRSLMQGDYMALAFAADAEVNRKAAGLTSAYAYLQVDANNLARVGGVGIAAEATPPGLIPLRLRHGRSRLSVGPNAFFFREGEGERYARARYGEFRVAPDGTALLTHLCDAQRQRITPQNTR